MKFDIFSRSEKHGKFEIGQGRVQILLSRPAALFATAQGVEALVGYGTDFDLQTSEVMTFWAEAKLDAKDVRVFVIEPERTSVVAEGEIFFNIDRMPDESGTLAEVTHARRMLELERRQMMAQVRAEREAMYGEVRAVRNEVRQAREAHQVPQPEGEAQ